jgi:tetratricopeptide (TPR) repeat protein
MSEISEKELLPHLKSLWLKAQNAVQVLNHVYAVKLLQEVLDQEPGFLEGRKLLRNSELILTSGGIKKSSFLGSGLGMMKVQSQAKKDPLGAISHIEKELEKDPYSEAANELLFEVALKLDMLETATFALETVRKGRPENSRVMHRLAEFYLQQEKPDLAAEVYNDIIRYHPTDGAAIKGTKDASARASMQKQRWDETTDMKTLMRDQSEFEELEKAARTGLTQEQLIERRDRAVERYNVDHGNLVAVKELASIYEQLEDWANAHVFYDWAHNLSPGDVALGARASLMKDKAIDAELKKLELAVQADPENQELRTQLERQRAARMTEKVDEAQKRVDQNPTDPQLRFELGSALYYAGDYSAAIPHLQQATRNPYIRTKVLLLLGRTFRSKGMFDLSIKQLSDALADLHAMDSVKKEVLYEKGLIHEEMGDKVAALDSFKQIYEVDYGYRDVAKRVESSYS